jgi:hypothetical protein
MANGKSKESNPSARIPKETSMFCTNCGASNENGATLCINCGESLANNWIEDKLSRMRGLDHVHSSDRLGFLHPLFDFSFRRSVTVKMMKFLYILSILCAGLMALVIILIGIETSLWIGRFALLLGAPVVFLLTVMISRVFLEMILAIFRITDHAADREVAYRGEPMLKEKTEPLENIQWNV